MKSRDGKSQRSEEKKKVDQKRESLRSKKIQVREPCFSNDLWLQRVESRLAKAAGCGPKHISKSKCTKDTRFGPLLEVKMMKKCTPLWREAHVEVKILKCTKVSISDHLWKLR